MSARCRASQANTPLPVAQRTPLTLSVKEGNVMFSKASKNQHLKERVRVAVESLQKKGVFLQIRKEYLGY